jgi:hypothetical protein
MPSKHRMAEAIITEVARIIGVGVRFENSRGGTSHRRAIFSWGGRERFAVFSPMTAERLQRAIAKSARKTIAELRSMST